MRMTEGPVFNLFVNCDIDYFQSVLLAKLGEAAQNGILEEIDSGQYRLSKNSRVFRMSKESDRITVPILDGIGSRTTEKTPLLIVEKREKTDALENSPYISIRLAIDTGDDHQKVQDYSPLRDLLRFDLESVITSPHVENTITWNSEKAQWSFGDVPTVHISRSQMGKLEDPMGIHFLFKAKPEKAISLDIDTAPSTLQQHPWSRDVFHADYQDFAIALYYFNLARLSARMILQSVVGPAQPQNSSDINPMTRDFIREEFMKFKDQDRQFMMNTLLWMGIDIWKEIDDIEYQLTSARLQNNNQFWSYFFGMGLNHLFPAAGNTMNSVKRRGFSDTLRGADTLCLFPELEEYYDHRPGKEYEQSDEYYMNISLALAWYAKSIGEEPFGCVVVKDGRIVGSGHNEIKAHFGDHTRHAEIIAIERARRLLPGNETLSGCKVYTTAKPCYMCGQIIRAHQGIDYVCIGTDSTMSGDVLENLRLADQGPPFGKPPETKILNIDELRVKFYQLYIETMGWTTMFPDLIARQRASDPYRGY